MAAPVKFLPGTMSLAAAAAFSVPITLFWSGYPMTWPQQVMEQFWGSGFESWSCHEQGELGHALKLSAAQDSHTHTNECDRTHKALRIVPGVS